MRNRFITGLLAGIVLCLALISIAGYVAVASGVMPANADARPPQIERWAARRSLAASIAKDAPRQQNPVVPTDKNLSDAIKLYGQNCAVCHGRADAKPTNIAQGFYQRVPQLAEDGVEDDPDGVTYWKITHGIRFTAMPAFIKTLDDRQRWELTMFLRQMDRLPPHADAAWHSLP